jgi:hypothetical protein
MSYIGAQAAMHRRRMIESPSCAAMIMQQPDLGRLGRLTGPPSVTLGSLADVVQVGGLPVSMPTASSFSLGSLSPWLLGAGLLLLGFAWYRSRSSGGVGGLMPKPRRRRTKRIPMLTAVLYAAGAGAGGYVIGKYL